MLADIAQYLQEKGVGTAGEDLFAGFYPETPEDCLVLLETEGLASNTAAGTETSGLQIVARWKNAYAQAENRLNAAHAALREIGFEDGEDAPGVVINGQQYFLVYPQTGGMQQLEDDGSMRKRIARNYYVVMHK